MQLQLTIIKDKHLRKPWDDFQLDVQDAHRDFRFRANSIDLKRMCQATTRGGKDLTPIQEMWANQSLVTSGVSFDQNQVEGIRECKQTRSISHLPSILLKFQ